MTLLQVDSLSIMAPNGARLVDSASFHVDPGEALGIVGESGSGKSLSCRAVLGIVPSPLAVEAVDIRFDGGDLLHATPSTWRAIRGTRIGAVFQDPGAYLNPSIPVGRQLAEVHRVKRGLARQDARDAAVAGFGELGLVDPERVARRLPRELSGGMLQRVMIAIAIAESPDLLIADEPTTALDVTVQAEVLDVLEDLRATRGVAILFVSHDLPVVAQVCERILVMQHGRIVEQGTATQVLHDPEHPYTRGLLSDHAEYGLDRFLVAEAAHV
ncbi:ABC transporter ATP-binding protein [Microbacterium suwonense]|uniref:ABC transporter ATP-binding protein n=1 Tax=Microbacterium suwonense TaxID=683047 RepID=UPI003623C024